MSDHKSEAESLLQSVSKKPALGYAPGLEGVEAARSRLCQCSLPCAIL